MKTNDIHQNYHQAKAAYEDSPGEYSYKYLFYAILPYLKKAAEETNLSHFAKTMLQMEHYDFAGKPKFANQVVWVFVSLFSKMRKAKNVSNQDFQTIFRHLQNLHYQKPSHEHSILLKFFLKRQGFYDCFTAFVDWWDVENLRTEDHQPETWKEITYPALAETFYSSHAKNLLARYSNSLPNQAEAFKAEAKAFIHQLRSKTIEYPHFKFFPYYAAKVQFKILGADGVEELFMPFARRNATQFWVWDFMADLHAGDLKTYTALLCRAMLCRADEAMKINIHTKLVDAFKDLKMLSQARCEIDTVIKIRQENGWKIPGNLLAVQRESWYSKTSPEKDQRKIYKEMATPSDALMFGQTTQIVALITGYSTQANKAWYVTQDLETGSFVPAKVQLHKPNPGMLIQMFMQQTRVLKAKPFTEILQKNLIEKVSGKIKIFNNSAFGILKGVFIPPDLIEKYKLKNQDPLDIIAVRSFDKKKSQWGWKAISIETSGS